jgi:hypothetical protein
MILKFFVHYSMFAASCVKFKKWFLLFLQGTARSSITHYVSVALFL